MPRGDGTGPMGMGPMTGRAAGYCAGYPVPGFMNPWGGRGMGMAWGRGGGFGMGMAWRRGWGGRFFGRRFAAYQPAPWAGWGYPGPFGAAPTREQELEMLREQADWLKEQMEGVSERIKELEESK